MLFAKVALADFVKKRVFVEDVLIASEVKCVSVFRSFLDAAWEFDVGVDFLFVVQPVDKSGGALRCADSTDENEGIGLVIEASERRSKFVNGFVENWRDHVSFAFEDGVAGAE
jgi:hypothetical protein